MVEKNDQERQTGAGPPHSATHTYSAPGSPHSWHTLLVCSLAQVHSQHLVCGDASAGWMVMGGLLEGFQKRTKDSPEGKDYIGKGLGQA